MAINEQVDSKELGGWRVHTGMSGIVDLPVETDEEAIAAIKRFLSYLPSNHTQPPPRMSVPAGSGAHAERILEILPESNNKVYDVRKVIECIVDAGSLFELKARFGRALLTGLARLGGQSVGIIANNPLFKGGAIDVDACRKVVSFMVLCDSFNVPLIFMADQPGFLIGKEGEQLAVTGKVMNWLNAMCLATAPKIALVLRKSYGPAVSNTGAGGNADELAAWASAEVSFMKPEVGATVVFGVRPEDGADRFAEAVAKMNRGTTAYHMAGVYTAQAVIDPRETCEFLIRMLDVHQLRLSGGVGGHLMRTWLTTH